MATLDRKNAYSALPQLEKRIAELGKYIDIKDGKITIRVKELNTLLSDEVSERKTLIRDFNGGTITCYVGEEYGVYTNASGSVDIVKLSWEGQTPTVEDTLGSFKVDEDFSGGSMLQVGAGEGIVRAFDMGGGTPTDLIIYNGLASESHSAPYIYFQGDGSSGEVSIGVQGYFKNGQFWRGPNDAGNEIIIDTSGIDVTGHLRTTGLVEAGTYLRSEYAYNHPGGASASTVASHTVYIAENGNLLMGTTESSRRFKHDIKAITNEELDPKRLYKLPVIQFVYNKEHLGNEKDCRYLRELPGFIAEDVAEIYPTAADINEEGDIVGWNEHYMIPPMLSLIQELNDRVTALEKELNLLRGEPEAEEGER